MAKTLIVNGMYIKVLGVKRGLTLAEINRRAGLSHGWIHKVLDRDTTSLAVVAKIAAALGDDVSPLDLLSVVDESQGAGHDRQ